MDAPSSISPVSSGARRPPHEVLPWLKDLPLAPEYRPTLAEFQDPVAYILKIEKEASHYGICKIIPPVPAPPRKTVIENLNLSLSSSNGERNPSFTPSQQQIGFCPSRPYSAQKPVWQSSHRYTLEQFEAKARRFERNQAKRSGKDDAILAPIEVETLFWKACLGKPLCVEYGNDIPGSGFAVRRGTGEEEDGNVGDSAWNTRDVSRVKGSLLEFIREDVPGVTSPMVYLGMMFSWFAWHVEDHELHSLNYHHMGAGKAWYGVPRDVWFAFEEVVRVHGYVGRVNPLEACTLLGEKTTVMAPEYLLRAGVPCCRLVQNPGEFVVTFPGAYHSGFSLGFNCCEATNIATPEWLSIAKDAAIRRASSGMAPMLSHYQLLYECALSLHSRDPESSSSEHGGSRLKDKMKWEGDTMVKEMFLQNVIQSNCQLDALLEKGSSCALFQMIPCDVPLASTLHFSSQAKIRQMMPTGTPSYRPTREQTKALRFSNDPPLANNGDREGGNGNKNSDLGGRLVSCISCGILSSACMAIVQPTESASAYLMYADSSSFIDQTSDYGDTNREIGAKFEPNYILHNGSGQVERANGNLSKDNLKLSASRAQHSDNAFDMSSEGAVKEGASALDLLVSTYRDDSSDSDESLPSGVADYFRMKDSPQPRYTHDASRGHRPRKASGINLHTKAIWRQYEPDDMPDPEDDLSTQESGSQLGNSHWMITRSAIDDQHEEVDNPSHLVNPLSSPDSCCKFRFRAAGNSAGDVFASMYNPSMRIVHKLDRDSSRMHIFCLEHAIEVEKRLRPVGGVRVILLCHPDYPKIEAEAKSVAKEWGVEYTWKTITFKEVDRDDKERIQSALHDEEAVPACRDWTVKMRINLHHSKNLSKSPLYSTQMPYNEVIYKAFGRDASGDSPRNPQGEGRDGRPRKLVIAGKWCGKVWKSNQVHRYLTQPKEGDNKNFNSEFHELPDTNHGLQSGLPPRNFSQITAEVGRQWSGKRKAAKDKTSARKLKFTELEGRERINDSAKKVFEKCELVPRSIWRQRPVDKVLDKHMGEDALRAEDSTGGQSLPSRRKPKKPEVAKEHKTATNLTLKAKR